MVRYKTARQRAVLFQSRLRAQLSAQQVLRHQGCWGFHLPPCQTICQSSASLPKSSCWWSPNPWGGSSAWAGGSESCAWWLQPCTVAPCPCQLLPPLPGSPRCFSWSSIPNAVIVWKQIGCTPSPLGTGYVARRDMLVAGCLHHLEALLNHLTAYLVFLSSTKEKKKPQHWKKTIHSSKAVEPYGRVSLYGVSLRNSILSSSVLHKKQQLSVV